MAGSASLYLPCLPAAGGGSATRETITQLFQQGDLRDVRSGIVYCAFKEDANQLAKALSARGVKAKAYHAGKDYKASQPSLALQPAGLAV